MPNKSCTARAHQLEKAEPPISSVLVGKFLTEPDLPTT